MADNPSPSTSYQVNPEKYDTCILIHKLVINSCNIEYLTQIIPHILLSDATILTQT